MEGVDCQLYGNSGASVFDAEVDGPTTVELFADSGENIYAKKIYFIHVFYPALKLSYK